VVRRERDAELERVQEHAQEERAPRSGGLDNARALLRRQRQAGLLLLLLLTTTIDCSRPGSAAP
jgi:hypothetical protein